MSMEEQAGTDGQEQIGPAPVRLEEMYAQGSDIKVGVHTFTVVNATGELLTLKAKEIIPAERIGGAA